MNLNSHFRIFTVRLHGKDNIAIKRYVISFWNGIDLRYKLLKGPSVKISIAGIIISRVRRLETEKWSLSFGRRSDLVVQLGSLIL